MTGQECDLGEGSSGEDSSNRLSNKAGIDDSWPVSDDEGLEVDTKVKEEKKQHKSCAQEDQEIYMLLLLLMG
ncbi:Ankyrin Repeat Domain-Containing Protein 26 [Manis pentadactyla]|nr:Ankyrin Repeat Domain-Containing Protein 26 [Manis pentadactyla]